MVMRAPDDSRAIFATIIAVAAAATASAIADAMIPMTSHTNHFHFIHLIIFLKCLGWTRNRKSGRRT